MAFTGAAGVFAAVFSPIFRREIQHGAGTGSGGGIRKTSSFTLRSAVSTRPTPTPTILSENGRLELRTTETEAVVKLVEESEEERRSLKDYFEQSKELIKPDGGPPRWFSPLECRSRMKNSPLLLYLPGIDGVGLGLILHQQSLGKIFDIWCLHIPVMDRTPFTDLMQLVEETIKSENYRSPNTPIYLVGDSVGGCLALSVAARNPDIDLILILANPATSFSKSQLQPLIPLVEAMPDQLPLGIPLLLGSLTGDPLRTATAGLENGLLLQRTVEGLTEGLVALSSYLPVLDDILPRETLLWKLKMLRIGSSFANSRLHAVKAQTLILTSGRDQLLPSQEEGEKLSRKLRKCEIRKFRDRGHFLFLEDDFDLVTTIKGTSFYRRAKSLNYVTDYLPPTPSEIKRSFEPYRLLEVATSPVTLSTLENGKIVRGLAGIPSEGPVVLVGYHMLLGLELPPLVSSFLRERNIMVRGIAHPMMFVQGKGEGNRVNVETFDSLRVMGAVPVSATNLYRLLSSKSYALLYPGGMREALHRKGEEYKLFWPEQSEFVRMAARFGAKIIPFGVVGEDDIGELVIDYNDYMRIPYFRDQIKQLTAENVKLRGDIGGEVSNQDQHLPLILPKLPGRFYYLFGKPIETEGMKQKLKDREKAHELYLHVKSEVEKNLAYLKKKRESDPYRSLLSRLVYQATNGSTSEIPTFEL